MAFEMYPYTNFHDLNLDWIISKIRAIDDAVNASQAAQIAAEAAQELAEAAQRLAESARDGSIEAKNLAIAAQTAAEQARDAARYYAEHIGDPVSGIVTQWLTDHVDPDTGYVIDDTLTIALAAADAAATGKGIRDIKNGLGNIDLSCLAFLNDGLYLDTSDVESANTMLAHTDYIEIPQEVFSVRVGNLTVSDNGNNTYHIFPNILFYDESKTLISYGNNSTDDYATYRLPDNCRYIRVNQPSQLTPPGSYTKKYLIRFLQYGYVDTFHDTIPASPTQTNTGIKLTAGVGYTFEMRSDMTAGHMNAYINGDTSVIAYIYKKGKAFFTPKTTGLLYLYNPSGTYYGDTVIDVYESSEIAAKKNETPTIYEVGSAKGWTSITELLLHLKDDDSQKIIYINGGDYNIFAEYTALGLLSGPDPSDPTFDYFDYNVWVPSNTHIIGRGRVRLLWQPTTGQISAAYSKTISPLNCAGSAIIENIEIHCKNGRYCIHDDPLGKGGYMGARKIYKNVRCYKYNNDTGYGFGSAVGFGLDPNMFYEFDDCYFEHVGNDTVFYVHSRGTADFPTDITTSPVIAVNHCIMKTAGYGFRLGNVNDQSQQQIKVLFAGCYIGGSGRICDEASSMLGNNPNCFDVTLLRCNAVPVNVISTVNPYPVQTY